MWGRQQYRHCYTCSDQCQHDYCWLNEYSFCPVTNANPDPAQANANASTTHTDANSFKAFSNPDPAQANPNPDTSAYSGCNDHNTKQWYICFQLTGVEYHCWNNSRMEQYYICSSYGDW
jgi:hypothetical protein